MSDGNKRNETVVEFGATLPIPALSIKGVLLSPLAFRPSCSDRSAKSLLLKQQSYADMSVKKSHRHQGELWQVWRSKMTLYPTLN
ncbi:hypothetical protein ACLOJK_040029 [Asimina triloba]